MAIVRIGHAAATCSWIDPKTGLPEVDSTPIVAPATNSGFLTGNSGYRFCNFISAWADIDTVKNRIVRKGFESVSGMYRGPSFLNIPSHAFMTSQDSFDEGSDARFTQVVGARTVSPEVAGAGGGVVVGAIAGGVIGSAVPVIGTAIGAIAGGVIGAFSGEAAAHAITGFPPIWTKIQIRICGNGQVEAQVLQHSLFPSMTFYVQKPPTSGVARSFAISSPAGASTYYNATKDVELPDWKERGWGQISSSKSLGPTGGNPWSIEKGVFGLGSSIPG